MFTFLRRTPLRVKLVASVLALVAFALTVIGVSVAVAMDRYFNNQVDIQLTQTLKGYLGAFREGPVYQINGSVPPNWLFAVKSTTGIGPANYGSEVRSTSDLPPFPTSIAKVQALSPKPYTVHSINRHVDWRMVAGVAPNGQILYIGQTLTSVQNSIHRLVIWELVAGGAVLVVLSALGAGVVRASLRPLTEIERTAAAIAAGDLTRRVPDFEPPGDEPRTEVGRLGKALNVMLGQIESSFQARTASEAAAREAAETARAAADAALHSEARAVASEERTRRFAADASHELRTPLTTIRGFAELYRQGAAADPEHTERLIRRIEDEAARMGLLVEDLLLLARLDQERPLEEAPVDLRVIGADAVVNAHAVAPGRRIDLDIAPDSGSLVVIGDELRLRQVVTNLMTNALTYTPATSPIAVRLGRSDRPGYVEISVVDAGPGLSQDQIDRIFERFYRVDSVRTRRAKDELSSGTGLGLAIVAAIVKAHRGTVEVTSAAANGSRPTEPSEPSEPTEPSESTESTESTEPSEQRGPGATFRVTLPAAPRDVAESDDAESTL